MTNQALVIQHTVGFPATYLEARNALARCELVDECKEMADKAAAIEVYARQSKDDSLVIMAQRIQARAIRRMGELLGEIEPRHGVKSGPTRTATARAAGVSAFKQATAMQVAAIPSEQFEKLVEAERPTRVAKLAAIGTKKGTRHADRITRVHRNCPTCTCREPEFGK